MNRIFASLVASLLLFSCSIESEEIRRTFNNHEEVIGTWQFYEYTFSTGSSKLLREKVKNGDVFLRFLTDGNLESLGYFECDQASYVIEDNKLIIDFECTEEVAKREYLLSWEGKNLVLSPLTPSTCIEGCFHVFLRHSE